MFELMARDLRSHSRYVLYFETLGRDNFALDRSEFSLVIHALARGGVDGSFNFV